MKTVHWRAIVRLPDGKEHRAWAKGVSERLIIIRSEAPLRSGMDCGLTLYVPQYGKEDLGVISMRCRAKESVLSSAEFRVWLEPMQILEGAQWLSSK